MAKKNVTYEIGLRDKMSKGLGKLEKKTSSLGSKIKGLGIAFGATFLASKAIQGIKNVTNAYNNQANAIAQVEQGIDSTGMAAGRTLDQLTKAASKFQDETLFGDEAVLQGVTSQLLTFTNISENAFDRTQQAVLDVTTRLYGANASAESLRSTSIQLGKALNDPVANLGALGRSGIQFSKEQKETIKTLAQTNRLADAQAIILGELEKQYGGSARAAAKAGTGAWKQVSNIFGDINEEIGKKLIKNTSNLSKGMKTLGKSILGIVKTPLSEELRETRYELNAEFNVLKRGNVTVEQRKRLIQDINSKYKDYLPSLLTEKSTLQDIEAAQNAANASLLKKIEIQAKAEIIEKSINKAAKARRKVYETELAAETALEISKTTKSSNVRKAELKKYFAYRRMLVKLNAKALAADERALNVQKSLGDFSMNIDTTAAKKGIGAIAGTLEKTGITKITAAAPKVFNININNLVETFNVTSSTIKEGAIDVRKQIEQALAEALTDVQAVS